MATPQELLPRDDWNAYAHEYTALSNGLDPDAEHTILPPDTLNSPASYMPAKARGATLAALHQAVTRARQPDGTLSDEVSALTSGPNANALIGGFEPEPRHHIETDQGVNTYLSQRAATVEASDAAFRRQHPEIIRTFRTGVAEGIRAGYIPANVSKRVDSAVKLTSVQIADSGILQYGAPHAHGDYDGLTDKARASHEADDRGRRLIFVHELFHKLSGGTFQYDADNQPVRIRVGFVGKQEKHVGLTEILNHQITLGALSGDFGTLDPDQRHDDVGNNAYYSQRKLAAVLVARSGNMIKLRTMTKASFEDNLEATNRRQMVSEARTAYGGGLFRKFDELCQAADKLEEDDPQYREKLDGLIARIHAPEVDGDGNLTQVGSINTDDLAESTTLPAAA